MYLNRCYDNSDMNQEMSQTSMNNGMMNGGCMCPPVMECPQEVVCHREICHEVPHVCPFM